MIKFRIERADCNCQRCGFGIGEAIARRLSSAGARVAVADIDSHGETATAGDIGNGAFAATLDISHANSIAAVVCGVLELTLSIDIVVNNAGMAGKAAPIWEQRNEDWHRVMALSVTGPFYLLPRSDFAHRARTYCRIVNIASIAGKEGNTNMVAYSSSKAALSALRNPLQKRLRRKESVLMPSRPRSSARRFSIS
jgi:NAD(P)-dependent dehydrogenase (short-subunit alcohol dehydrogenase family)